MHTAQRHHNIQYMDFVLFAWFLSFAWILFVFLHGFCLLHGICFCFFAWFCRVLLDVHCTQHLPGTLRISKQIYSKDLTKDERKDLASGDLFDKSQRKTNLRIRVKSLDTCQKILHCVYILRFCPREKKHRVLGQSFT